MPQILVVNANPLLNLVYTGAFVPGALNRVPGLAMAAEGKGVNLARLLARHGHSVLVTGFAGGHSGAWLRDLVRAEGIGDAWIETAAPLRVGFMAAGPDVEHPTTVLPNGFPVAAEECRALLERVESLLPSLALVIASGSVPDPAAESLYVDLLALCARFHVPCWLDAYGPAMDRALAGPFAPLLSTPNRQEYEQCRHWERVKELHVTDGADAVRVETADEGRWRVIPPAIRQLNPVGSGDCYLAGLAHGRLRGMDFEDCLRYAAAAGAANAMRQEVAMIGEADILPLLGLVRVERLAD
jgi:fructose-1-phosphate kinase PfkB-like protein